MIHASPFNKVILEAKNYYVLIVEVRHCLPVMELLSTDLNIHAKRRQ